MGSVTLQTNSKLPPKPPSPILAQVKALVDSIAQMKEAYEADKNESERRDKVLYKKIKLLTLANKDLSTRVASLEGISYEMELDDRDALLDPSLRGVGTGNVSGGNEENNVGGNTHREALEKAERSAISQTAADLLKAGEVVHWMGEFSKFRQIRPVLI